MRRAIDLGTWAIEVFDFAEIFDVSENIESAAEAWDKYDLFDKWDACKLRSTKYKCVGGVIIIIK